MAKLPPPPPPRADSRCPLPSLAHLRGSDWASVYEPSDDTYLLLDALAADLAVLRAALPGVVLELGSGSGCIITGLAQILVRGGVPAASAALVATDLNASANAATAATAAANSVPLEVVRADLLGAVRPGTVDVLLFNPPYVPTSEEEAASGQAERDISAAWAGGPDGRVVVDRLLPDLGRLLSARGVFYLLGVRENRPDELAAQVEAQHGMRAELIAERRAQNERLFVMRFSRSQPASA